MTAPERFADSQIPLAPRAPSIHDPGRVKTLRGITAPGILRLVVTFRAKNAKSRPALGITTKSDFVFAQPRPKPVRMQIIGIVHTRSAVAPGNPG
jgi:hypothetical protein